MRCGWLGALLALEIDEPFMRELAEGSPAPATLLGVPIKALLIRMVRLDQLEHPGRRLRLGQHTLRRLATLSTPAVLAVWFGPGTPEGAHDRFALSRPLGRPESAGRPLPKKWSRRWLGNWHSGHPIASVGLRATVGQRLFGQRSRATFSSISAAITGDMTHLSAVPARFRASAAALHAGDHRFESGWGYYYYLLARSARTWVGRLPTRSAPRLR